MGKSTASKNTTLVPGRKYRLPSLSGVHTFIGMDGDCPVFRNGHHPYHNQYFHSLTTDKWTEYREPVEHLIYVCWIKRPDGRIEKAMMDAPMTGQYMAPNNTLLQVDTVRYMEKFD